MSQNDLRLIWISLYCPQFEHIDTDTHMYIHTQERVKFMFFFLIFIYLFLPTLWNNAFYSFDHYLIIIRLACKFEDRNVTERPDNNYSL